MLICEIIEDRLQVSKKEVDNPHPMATHPEFKDWFGDERISAMDVLRDILGYENIFDSDIHDESDYKPNQYFVHQSSRDLHVQHEDGTNAIELKQPRGKRPKDIAVAAHEAYHALLSSRGKNYANEHMVNRLAARWLQDHLLGMFLHQAMESLLSSKLSYKGNKYLPSWVAKQFGEYTPY